MVRQPKAVHRISQRQLSIHDPGCAEDVVDALWWVSQGCRICTVTCA